MKALLLAMVLGPMAWAASNHQGSYIVPAPAELAAVSAIPTEYEVGATAEGRLTLKYCLPEELTGSRPYHVNLVETADHGEWVDLRGDNGDSARCSINSGSLTCFVLYPGLLTDTNSVNEVLHTKYAGSSTLPLREKLATLFSNDPKGVVSCPFR